LKQLINTKELCKQIRYCNSGFLIWTKEKDQNFITNRHFLVRFDEVPREVLAALFSVFYKLPEVGETMVSHFGSIQDDPKPINYNGIYQPDKQDTEGTITPFMRDMGRKHLTRFIKFPKNHAYVSESYAKLSAEFESPVKSSTQPNSPIYFADGDLLILPYRITENSKDVIDLLGDELNATTRTP
jgi:hypothetical protein